MPQAGNVEGAYRTLNRIRTMDGLFADINQWRLGEALLDREKAMKLDSESTAWEWLTRTTY